MSASDLAARIRNLRTERSWSQEHLAGAAGLSLRTVQRVESGYACAADTLMALAAAFGIPPSDFTQLVPPPSSGEERVLGLTPRQAAWIGLVISVPAILFVCANLANEFWDIGWTGEFVATTAPRIGLDNPLLIIGGPLAALFLNVLQIVRFDVRHSGSGIIVDRLQLRLSAASVTVVVATGACLVVLGGYLVLENLGHAVSQLIDR